MQSSPKSSFHKCTCSPNELVSGTMFAMRIDSHTSPRYCLLSGLGKESTPGLSPDGRPCFFAREPQSDQPSSLRLVSGRMAKIQGAVWHWGCLSRREWPLAKHEVHILEYPS